MVLFPFWFRNRFVVVKFCTTTKELIIAWCLFQCEVYLLASTSWRKLTKKVISQGSPFPLHLRSLNLKDRKCFWPFLYQITMYLLPAAESWVCLAHGPVKNKCSLDSKFLSFMIILQTCILSIRSWERSWWRTYWC